MRLAVPLAAALALALPAAAQAATVTATYREDEGYKGNVYVYSEVEFEAAPGEANALTVERDGGDLVFRDGGAELRAAGRCAQVDAHTARCTPGPGTTFSDAGRIVLGDGADSLTAPGGTYGPMAYGGDGDDRLTLTGGAGWLEGGGGADVLTGGERLSGGVGADRLDGGAGRDQLDGGDGEDSIEGGEGFDMVGFGGYLGGLAVDLGDPRPDGPVGGALDSLTGVEGVYGGPNADTIRGDAGPNALTGGGGNDVLSGRDGADVLKGDGGADVLKGEDGDDRLSDARGGNRMSGGPGDDVLDLGFEAAPRADRVACGPGADTVSKPQARVLFPLDCERAELHG
ncbi:MAG: hypothetical protein M3340_18220, partial [Actinomycetota bacterium]|nr:hypothetical protein [Actinomycetota bacterium]